MVSIDRGEGYVCVSAGKRAYEKGRAAKFICLKEKIGNTMRTARINRNIKFLHHQIDTLRRGRRCPIIIECHCAKKASLVAMTASIASLPVTYSGPVVCPGKFSSFGHSFTLSSCFSTDPHALGHSKQGGVRISFFGGK